MTTPNATQANDLISIGNRLVTAGNAILAALGTSPPPPPTGAAWQVPPATSGVDAQGHVWSLGAAALYGKLVLRDGVPFAGGQAVLIDFRNGTIKVQNSVPGNWWTPSGNGWVATSAP